jgi:hypothetical protein
MQIYERADGTWGVQGNPATYATEQEARNAMQQAEYVRAVKAANKQIWDGIAELAKLRKEWDALALGDTLADVEGVTGVEVGAVVHATGEALEAVLAAGHATNMARLLR